MSLRQANLLFVCVLCLMFSMSVFSKLVPIENFVKFPEYSNVRISPNGEYLAVISSRNEKRALSIMETKSFKVMHIVHFDKDAQVGDYNWVSNDRVVLQKQYISGLYAAPIYYGELVGVNADGSKEEYLVGVRGATQLRAKFTKNEALYGTSWVLDPLIDDKENMLIYTQPWGGRNSNVSPLPVVYKVNVFNGRRKEVVKAPIRGANFLVDNSGKVRGAAGSTNFVDNDLFILNKDRRWKKLPLKASGLNIRDGIGFSADNSSVFVLADTDGEAQSIYEIDLMKMQPKLLHESQMSDPMGYQLDPSTKAIFAIEYMDDYPSYVYLDQTSRHSQILKGLSGLFKEKHVEIINSTRSGDLSVLYVSSDKDPGQYYLLNTKSMKINPLLNSREWIEPERMASVEPIRFVSRDGVTINGYLTLPAGKKAKDLPLVVMPHGGPHGPRDYWGFSPEPQLLASRGMAVLQVNFRGSGGYGQAFERSGHRKWGKEIQHDIIDGTRYVISEGIVDRENICIMGASFGGYSALQSAILEPDLFQCAIGVVGVYDLPDLFERGNVSRMRKGQKYLSIVLGDDEKQLTAFSPTHNLDKLKVPVFIIHGEEDNQAPIEQAHVLVKKLEKRQHPYQYLELDDEGHGFYRQEHRQEYFESVLDFLNKYLDI